MRGAWAWLAAVCALGGGVGGCEAEPPPQRRVIEAPKEAGSPGVSPPSAGSAATPSAGSAANPSAGSEAAPEAAVGAWRLPAPRRLVALGDLHGDLEATRRALKLAGAIDASDKWVGGDLVIVQTGDILDRGDGEREILDLLGRLEGEAEAAGGRLVRLNGNHEVMNVAGDFRYVTPGGFEDFLQVEGADLSRPEVQRVPEVARGRAAAFLPGAPYAKLLARYNVVGVVGDTVFVHGGVGPEFAGEVEAINRETSQWMLGQRPAPPKGVTAQDGPVWSREFAQGEDEATCGRLRASLDALGVKRMVIGHTPQLQGVTSGCGGMVWRVDVGMAAHYGGPTEVLEIVGEQVKVLR